MVGRYRKLIRNLASKSRKQFEMTPEGKKGFRLLKEMLFSAPVLRIAGFIKPF